MILAFTIAAIIALLLEQSDTALIWSVLAVAWALNGQRSRPGLLRSWLGWDAAIAREQARREDDGGTLFSGRRDDAD